MAHRFSLLTAHIRRLVCIGLLLGGSLFGDQYDPSLSYYNGVDGLTGTALSNSLHNIIDNHTDLGYDAMRYAPRVLDVDPNNSSNIILIYSGYSIPGHTFNSQWNREHAWPQSFGADSGTKPGADFHHLFPANPGVNSARSNLIFDWTDPGNYQSVSNAPGSSKDNNSFEPRDADKGRIARAMLYMDLRYDSGDGYGDFNLAESANQSSKRMAKLSTLLEWNRLFPPDEHERRRNHLIHNGFEFASFNYKQGNRNPFVDIPDVADVIFDDPDLYAWGEWRWEHFSINDYFSGDKIAPFGDPDNDLLLNLIEYSADLDPMVAESPDLLSKIRFAGFAIQLRYSRQRNSIRGGITYAVEKSQTPLREETWEPLSAQDITNESTSGSGNPETVTLNLKDLGADMYFRLVVSQSVGHETLEAFFDPVATYDPTGSIFVYDNILGGTGWTDSDWMGELADDNYPWVYHKQHGPIYVDAWRDDIVWTSDPAIGWFYSSSELYPWIYHVDSDEWYYYHTLSASPNRMFMNSNKQWLPETQLAPST